MSRRLGADAEDRAAEFLRRRGYTIRARNFQRRFGELDIVAEDAGVLCFVEVRARKDAAHGAPAETVSASKQRRIIRAAQAYLQTVGREHAACRFDVVAITGDAIELLQNAFEA